MRILLISDLHLCDVRNGEAFEERRLVELRRFIEGSGSGLVVNLGDTVSRREFLRPGFPDLEAGYGRYLRWRRGLSVPFVECAVAREFPFFGRVLGQEPDSVCTLCPEMTVVTLAPRLHHDHVLAPEQIAFLEDAVGRCRAPRILIASHVPYPGSCSRQAAPGIFLAIPDRVRSLVEAADRPVYWCGGHFHWDEEPPRRFGSLTAFHGGRFAFQSHPGRNGWLRTIDSRTGTIATAIRDFAW